MDWFSAEPDQQKLSLKASEIELKLEDSRGLLKEHMQGPACFPANLPMLRTAADGSQEL